MSPKITENWDLRMTYDQARRMWGHKSDSQLAAGFMGRKHIQEIEGKVELEVDFLNKAFQGTP